MVWNGGIQAALDAESYIKRVARGVFVTEKQESIPNSCEVLAQTDWGGEDRHYRQWDRKDVVRFCDSVSFDSWEFQEEWRCETESLWLVDEFVQLKQDNFQHEKVRISCDEWRRLFQ